MEQQHALARNEESNLVVLPEFSTERSAWALMREQAAELVQSGLLPSSVKTPAAAIAIMQTGREFGLQPMQSFRVIHIIEGKPTLSTQFMAALVNRHCSKHGGYLRQAELSEQRCVIEYKRPEWPGPQTFSFSLEDAKRAGLTGKGNWSKHPREMMYNRAVSNACRMGWPELVAGVYDPDELDAPVYEAQPVTIDQPHDAEMASPSVAVRPERDERDRANARYFAIVTQKGLSDDERRALQRIAYGVDSAKEMSADQLRQLADRIEQRSADELRAAIERQREMDQDDEPEPVFDPASPIPDYVDKIAAAPDAAALKAITSELQTIGVWAPELTAAVSAKRTELGLPAPDATKSRTRSINSIVDQAPAQSGEPGNDQHTR